MPRFVWFLEIALIVVRQVIAVLTAHQAALRFALTHDRVVRSGVALTVLMFLNTITRGWLLAQPLVT